MSASNGKSRRSPTRTGGPLTRRQRDLYVAELAEGATHEAAARTAGRSRSTFKGLRQRDEKFAVKVGEAVDRGTEMVEQQLVEIAFGRIEAKNNAQVTACFGLLRKRRPDLWREHYREAERERGRRLDTSKLSGEELNALLALLAKARA